jgi:hypothetical protein
MCGGCDFGLKSLPNASEFAPAHLDVVRTPPQQSFKFDALTSRLQDAFVLAAKSFGANYLVLSASHCSGYLLWPSRAEIPGLGRYNYSVAQSPWRGGQGDVVREFTEACNRHGMRYGFYVNLGLNMSLSPPT